MLQSCLGKAIVPIGADTLTFFDGGKFQEMRGSVHFVRTSFFGVGHVEFILHGRIVTNAHEVVVPRAQSGIMKNLVTYLHLNRIVLLLLLHSIKIDKHMCWW